MSARSCSLVLLATILLGSGGRADLTRGLRPLRGVVPPPNSSLSVSSCAACHEEQTEQWRRSWHAKASTDPLFVASVRGARGEQWCRNCHSPLPEQQAALAELPGGLASEGISCAVCHIRDGAVLTAKPPPLHPEGPHRLVYAPELASADFCGGCHQFPFPKGELLPKVRYTSTPMQDTLHEWQQTDAPPCQTCHMPDGSHTFPGAHDRDWLEETLSASVRPIPRPEGLSPRTPETWAEVTFTARGAAHRLPTGDPFRRLYVEICADPDCARVLGVANAARHFNGEEGDWREGVDRSIPPPRPGEQLSSRTFAVPVEAGPPWSYRLVYQYAEERLVDELPPEEVSVTLAEGTVAP